MSTDPDRNQLDDRLLRASLRPGQIAGNDACLDAETLAAWSDGTLSAGLTADIDLHLASCARCQDMLAAFAKSEPVDAAAAIAPAGAATVIPFRPRWTTRWLVPLAAGTVAAGLVMWASWPKPATPSAAESAVARVEPTPPSAPTPLTAAPPVAADERSASVKSLDAQAKQLGEYRKQQTAPKQAPVPRPSLASPPAGAASAAGAAAAAPPPAATPPQPPPAPQPVPQARVSPVTTGAAAGRADVVTMTGAAGLVRADRPSVLQTQVVAEFAVPTAAGGGIGQAFRGAGRGGAGGGGGTRAMAGERASSPVRWRVLVSGQVEKSTSGGTTWEPVKITPPVPVVNGAAPSASVCWLVGRTGIVLLSTDGVKFTRVTFPDVSDLRSIKAVDARQASITTTDGRVFTTVDGGETWVLEK